VFQTQTIIEQVTTHLREQLEQGRWTGLMPGRDLLAAELGVNKSTIDLALVQLEKEGWLQSQGPGKRRAIVAAKRKTTKIPVEMILYEPADRLDYSVIDLHYHLEAAGHVFSFAPKTLVELKHDPERVARMVESRPGKAWIVESGTRAVLEWFAQSSVPSFALFGMLTGLPIAGFAPDFHPTLRITMQRLFELGHEKIVLLVREERHRSGLGETERFFMELLREQGLSPGAYNLPEFQDNADGLRQCLDSLFKYTPPTAILVGDPILYVGVRNYIAERRGLPSRQVTLICSDYDPRFDWCQPAVPHFRWDAGALVRHTMHWVNQLAKGKEDKRQHLVPAELMGTEGIRKPVL